MTWLILGPENWWPQGWWPGIAEQSQAQPEPAPGGGYAFPLGWRKEILGVATFDASRLSQHAFATVTNPRDAAGAFGLSARMAGSGTVSMQDREDEETAAVMLLMALYHARI